MKRYQARPEAEWLRIEAPELQIVPEELWLAALRRLERSREVYARTGSRAPLDRGADYLLSGIAKCAAYGGSLVAFTILGRDIPRTRQILRKLLVGRLTCAPFEEKGRRGYRFTGQGSYAEVLPASLSTLVVTPAGFAEWCGFGIAGEAVA